MISLSVILKITDHHSLDGDNTSSDGTGSAITLNIVNQCSRIATDFEGAKVKDIVCTHVVRRINKILVGHICGQDSQVAVFTADKIGIDIESKCGGSAADGSRMNTACRT